MTRKQRRLVLIGSSLGVLALAAVLVLSALKDFDRVLQFADRRGGKTRAPGSRIRLGGLVKPGTLQRGDNLQCASKSPTATATSRSAIKASCRTCSAKGRASSRKARSNPAAASKPISVLAKHDENYMPKEVVDALKKQGRWEEGTGKKK